ncbi:MAG: bifunctional folylpolyglutamate synthase/dihydrofolate synthase [Candidatus Omnitrophica bacterium]|nr:bifunctional folylpolyglutamate synthase/dihydrofolate synthase [Candidatus Omnitrophota bacterium]MBU4149009.1 bifunctional folylpolyglutamate synthase/dihydrofolate synthase [Candidatus Omnitrophota bacterium]
MDYASVLEYVGSFIDFEKIPQYSYASSFNLERMYAFLHELGNPHNEFKAVHVAGSKGKGSTCAILAYILKEAGYSAGLYTSPHLLDMRERIRILGKGRRVKGGGFEGVIGKEEFVRLIERIRPVAEKFRDHKYLGKLSFFEILTAAAFLYFKERQVDIAVLETGLGGRLDATNVVQPLVCGVTNISMEHADKLGNTLNAIAMEKAGIIKGRGRGAESGGVTVTASQEKEVIDVIRKASEEKGTGLYEIGKDIRYSILKSGEKGMVFNLNGPGYSYNDLELNLIGAHQVENASLAVAMVKSLPANRYKIDEQSIRSGLEKISWPGRLYIAQKDPCILLDGAQNVASMKAVLSSIKEIFNYNRLICIFGVSSDKDIKGVSKELDAACDVVILTRSGNARAAHPRYLKENFPHSRPGLECSNNLEDAMRRALELADKKDLILVTGSLFLVGEALNLTKRVMHKVSS